MFVVLSLFALSSLDSCSNLVQAKLILACCPTAPHKLPPRQNTAQSELPDDIQVNVDPSVIECP